MFLVSESAVNHYTNINILSFQILTLLVGTFLTDILQNRQIKISLDETNGYSLGSSNCARFWIAWSDQALTKCLGVFFNVNDRFIE